MTGEPWECLNSANFAVQGFACVAPSPFREIILGVGALLALAISYVSAMYWLQGHALKLKTARLEWLRHLDKRIAAVSFVAFCVWILFLIGVVGLLAFPIGAAVLIAEAIVSFILLVTVLRGLRSAQRLCALTPDRIRPRPVTGTGLAVARGGGPPESGP